LLETEQRLRRTRNGLGQVLNLEEGCLEEVDLRGGRRGKALLSLSLSLFTLNFTSIEGKGKKG
jgi:hypothetical protein